MQSQLEAKKFKHDVVGTEHLVLAIARAGVIEVTTYKEVEKIVIEMYENKSNETNSSGMNENETKPSTNKNFLI